MTDAQSREKVARALYDDASKSFYEQPADPFDNLSELSRQVWLKRADVAVDALAHTPQRDEQITRILDRLKGGVGTFLQGNGERLASYVEGLERDNDNLRNEEALSRDMIHDLRKYRDELKRQLAERDAEIERLMK